MADSKPNPSVQNLITEFEAIYPVVRSWGVGSSNTFAVTWGWNAPYLTVADFFERIDQTCDRLRSIDDLPTEDEASMRTFVEQAAYFRGNSLPNLPGSNAAVVTRILFDFLDKVDRFIDPLLPKPPVLPGWEEAASKGLLPPALLQRLRSVEGSLRAVEPRAAKLEDKIATIERAYDSAERLPTDVATLAEGQREITETRERAKRYATEMGGDAAKTAEKKAEIDALVTQAEAIFDRLEKVYKAAATAGLARAFGSRARGLNLSLAVWVFLLMADLAIGGWIGHERFSAMESILSRPLPATTFWANLVFSLASLAAPIWFGWVATKQINQRFRLAEDYSFKASVASAYEGYRSEAARLDPEFQKRLFGSALTRLEEAPLRFVETENFGTPWHELTSSPAFAKALDRIPDLKETLAKIVAAASGAVAGAGALAGALKPSPIEKKDATEDPV